MREPNSLLGAHWIARAMAARPLRGFAALVLVLAAALAFGAPANPVATVEAQSAPPVGATITKNVYVVIFDPTVPYYYDTATGTVTPTSDPARYTKLSRLGDQATGSNPDAWNSPTQLALDYATWIELMSSGSPANRRIRYNIVGSSDTNSFVQKLAPNTTIDPVAYINNCFLGGNTTAPPCTGDTNVQWLVEDLFDNPSAPDPEANNICRRFNRGDFDELWVFNGPFFGFAESTLVGPNHFSYNDGGFNSWTATTSCTRLMPIMGFVYERSMKEMLENFGHRLEATMTQVYGSWSNTPTHNWDRFALLDFLSPESYNGCGRAHFTPNATGMADEYVYHRANTANSICEQFLTSYPVINTSTVQSVNAATWDASDGVTGCTTAPVGYPCKLDFYRWWYSRVPHFSGIGSDAILYDWWQYIIDPNLAVSSTVVPVAANLALNRSIVSTTGVENALLVNDGAKVANGTYSRVGLAAPFSAVGSGSSSVVIDLGVASTIQSVVLQADSNDAFLVEYATSLSPANWASLTTVPASGSSGLTTRTVNGLSASGRYIRLSASSGSVPYTVTEIEVYGSNTPTATSTRTPTRTPTRTNTPTPSRTPTRTNTPVPGSLRLDVVIRGNDLDIYQRTFSSNAWGGWQWLSSPPNDATSDPAITSWGNGRLDVFVRGSDNALWQRTFSGGAWGNWVSLSGGLTSGPDATSWGSGRIDVVIRGNDNDIYQRTFSGGVWSNWQHLSSPPNDATSDPSIVSWGSGRLDVFVRGSDNALWQRTFSGGAWGNWISLSGGLTSGPDATSWGSGRIDVVIRGNDNDIYQRTFSGGVWSNWQWLSSPPNDATSNPSIVTGSNGRLDVFVRGSDNALWQRTFSGGAWGNWVSLSGGLTSGPDAASWSLR